MLSLCSHTGGAHSLYATSSRLHHSLITTRVATHLCRPMLARTHRAGVERRLLRPCGGKHDLHSPRLRGGRAMQAGFVLATVELRAWLRDRGSSMVSTPIDTNRNRHSGPPRDAKTVPSATATPLSFCGAFLNSSLPLLADCNRCLGGLGQREVASVGLLASMAPSSEPSATRSPSTSPARPGAIGANHLQAGIQS